MSNRNLLFTLAFFGAGIFHLQAQDLLSSLDSTAQPKREIIQGTFKTSRIVIGQSIENPPAGNLLFIITHHFGAINTGYENLFGLKQAAIRIGAEYGIIDHLAIGAGLNTDRNTWDGFVKFKLLRQSKGAKKIPLSISGFVNTAIYTNKWTNPDQKNYFTSRMTYTFELMLARKFGEVASLQIMPAMVHKNLVETSQDHNDIFSIGAGGRIKLSHRVSVNAEYHWLLPDQIYSYNAYDSFSVGVDIETGGHVFQIFLTNSAGEYEQTILTETQERWSKGGIFLGFNINRIFTIVQPKEFRK